MTQTVVGLFDNASEAQQAVQELLSSGFTNANVDISSVASGTTSGSTDLSSGTSSTNFTSGTNTSGTNDNESGISKFFKNLFGDDDNDADKYSTVASRSNSIVTVYAQTADEAERAADILDDNGAINVDEKSSQYGYGSSSGTTGSSSDVNVVGTGMGTAGMGSSVLGSVDMGTTTGNTYDNTTRGDTFNSTSDTSDVNRSIPIIEENLEVGKRTVQTGGVRLRSRIVQRPVEETLRLREERVNVERNTVDRPATEADFTAFKEGEIEMIERSEVPVVSKEARVVEEISLGKEVNERTETISDTVRKTEVDVENIEGKTNTSSSSSTDLGRE